MPRDWLPHPRERLAEQFRRARIRSEREPRGHPAHDGFDFEDGYHGAYADRPGYATPRGALRPPGPRGSGWPDALREISPAAAARHRRAQRDRELAREVAERVFLAVGRDADDVAVFAADGVITLTGRLRSPLAEEWVVRAARATPHVRWVRTRWRSGRWPASAGRP